MILGGPLGVVLDAAVTTALVFAIAVLPSTAMRPHWRQWRLYYAVWGIPAFTLLLGIIEFADKIEAATGLSFIPQIVIGAAVASAYAFLLLRLFKPPRS